MFRHPSTKPLEDPLRPCGVKHPQHYSTGPAVAEEDYATVGQYQTSVEAEKAPLEGLLSSWKSRPLRQRTPSAGE